MWKKTLQDQSNSPAYHTRALLVGCPEDITTVDAEQGGWILSLSRVVRFGVHSNPEKLSDPVASLVPLNGFSPVLKYLRVLSSTLLNSQIFNLISSLPLLQDLTLGISGVDDDAIDFGAPLRVVQPTSAAFTGTLDLTMFRGMGPTTRRLLVLPNGPHFREFVLTCFREEDLQWVIALVSWCSDTLERLAVTCNLRGISVSSLDPTL